MQHSTRVLRSAITALTALFLVAGVALAASVFVAGNLRQLDGRPAALDQAAPTTAPTDAPTAAPTSDPTQQGQAGDQDGDSQGGNGGNGGQDGGGDH